MQLLISAGLLALPVASAILSRPRVPKAIPHSWTVQLKEGASFPGVLTQLFNITQVQPSELFHIGDLKALSLDNVGDDLISTVLALTEVESIEPNSEVFTFDSVVENGAPWGLARISHHDNTVIGGNGTGEYIYDETAGAGTCSYVIDTGIYVSHPEFQGRAIWGQNFAGDGNDTDGNGHGTHVAGTIGSKTFGLAKLTKLIAVKVLDASGSGNNTSVMKGIEWAVNDSKTREGCNGTSVINLSLGGAYSSAINAAVAEAVKLDLFVAVAAGNEGLPAFTSSPASASEVCTVAASDINDQRAYFSNWGSSVDVFGPGVNITSTWSPDSVEYPATVAIASGTSMASPHIAGLGAYLLGLDGKQKASGLCNVIQKLSTKGKLNNTWGLPLLFTKNYLAYNGNDNLQIGDFQGQDF